MTENIIEITSNITNYVFDSIYRKIKEFMKSGYTGDIILLINCPGGEVNQGFAIIDLLNLLPNKKIGVIIGKCDSMAGPIFLNCDERYMTQNSSFMFHGTSIDLTEGRHDTADIYKICLKAQKITKKIQEFIKSKTNIPESELQKIFKSTEENYLYADDCLKYGVITKIISSISELNIIWDTDTFMKNLNNTTK